MVNYQHKYKKYKKKYLQSRDALGNDENKALDDYRNYLSRLRTEIISVSMVKSILDFLVTSKKYLHPDEVDLLVDVVMMRLISGLKNICKCMHLHIFFESRYSATAYYRFAKYSSYYRHF